MALAGDRLGEVGWHVPCVWEVKSVPAELGHDVLPEDDDLLGTELNPGRIGEKLAAVKTKLKR